MVSSAAAKAALENLSSLHRTIEIENPLDNPEVDTVYREWFGGRYAHYYNDDLWYRKLTWSDSYAVNQQTGLRKGYYRQFSYIGLPEDYGNILR